MGIEHPKCSVCGKIMVLEPRSSGKDYICSPRCEFKSWTNRIAILTKELREAEINTEANPDD